MCVCATTSDSHFHGTIHFTCSTPAPFDRQLDADPREAYIAKAKALRDEYVTLKVSGGMDDAHPGRGGGSPAVAERLAKLRQKSALAKKAPEGPEPAALIALYNATGGDAWKKTTMWTMDTPFKRWRQLKLGDQVRSSTLLLFS